MRSKTGSERIRFFVVQFSSSQSSHQPFSAVTSTEGFPTLLCRFSDLFPCGIRGFFPPLLPTRFCPPTIFNLRGITRWSTVLCSFDRWYGASSPPTSHDGFVPQSLIFPSRVFLFFVRSFFHRARLLAALLIMENRNRLGGFGGVILVRVTVRIPSKPSLTPSASPSKFVYAEPRGLSSSPSPEICVFFFLPSPSVC